MSKLMKQEAIDITVETLTKAAEWNAKDRLEHIERVKKAIEWFSDHVTLWVRGEPNPQYLMSKLKVDDVDYLCTGVFLIYPSASFNLHSIMAISSPLRQIEF